MKVIIVDGDKTSLTVDLLRYCESRGILVEEKFTSTNKPQGEICSEFEYGKQCEACVNWVCGLRPCILGRKRRPVR